jgi:hypothetical protein
MTSRFHDELGRELLRVGLQEQRRRRRRIRAAAASVLAAAAGSLTLLWPNPAAADVEVRYEGGRVVIDITGNGASPEEVVDALRDAGVDAAVDGQSTGPSGVGRFVSAHVVGGEDQPIVIDPEPIGSAFRTFSIPEAFSGKLTLGVGVPSDGPGRYEASSDAFGRGEPLRCRGVLGARLQDVTEELREFDVSVRTYREGLFLGELPLADALESETADWFIDAGISNGPRTVALQVVEEPGAQESGC